MKVKYVLMLFLCLLSVVGCRKSATHNRRLSSNNEVAVEQKKQDKTEDSNRRIERSKNPLSGSEIFDRYNSAVFMIITSDGTHHYQGSGFFVGLHGLAVSNYHVFQGTYVGEEYIKIAGDDENLYKVNSIIYRSKEPDFIVFKVDYDNHNYIPIADEKPKVGDKVYAIGSPRGLENTFSSGEISQWRSDYLMQTNAMIDHGSSGGALINEYGEVVGITSGSLYDGSQANLNYAWSISAVKGHLK